jgi:hypothetical protein
MLAAARKSLSTVIAISALLVSRGIVKVAGTLGLKTSLSTEIRIHVDTIRSDSKALAAEGADESGVSHVTFGAAFVGHGVNDISER